MVRGFNPIINCDMPDPDVIRVGDTYYMCSTTMYYMPGAAILRSYDLINWEFCSHVYETLEDTPCQNLDGEENAYANGMWAPSLRYHDGRFYVIFIANDTRKTYCFTAENPEGPWAKSYIDGFYHDCSVLFDDDGRVYIMYGNRNIRVTELKPDLSAPLEGGFDKIVIRDAPGDFLGYEGSHLYKIDGRYYAFFIHAAKDEWRRIEAAYMADSLDGEWVGGDVIDYKLPDTTGVAQGGIVDTPDGRWFGVIFADRGAAGRMPNLVPMHFDGNGFPVFDTPSETVENTSTRPDYKYSPLFVSDDFTSARLNPAWEFNHNPKPEYWSTGGGRFTITTEKLSNSVEFARNTLTQRAKYPECEEHVTLDASGLQDGDTAGLTMLQYQYGIIGLTKEQGSTYLVMKSREKTCAKIPFDGETVTLGVKGKFSLNESEVQFMYLRDGEWTDFGEAVYPTFDLRHFVGCRIGLFAYSVEKTGGVAEFSHFVYL
ncbi:MAG: glycoside hydrolase 43 family protein [Oscillospiraceae bacterium]|nr:glycoside hydrolase 43 family protein [Oscillospiraceae bacterium]